MDAVEQLLDIMATLRDRERGCAWDLQQDFDSIAPYTVEEAFEVAEAIAARDWSELREELGDLLLQVVFHAQMAQEQALFSFADVVDTLNDKLRRRHPHVFGQTRTDSVAEIKANWEAIKATERADKGRDQTSVLDGVPLGLPALQVARKLQKKAASIGFDWPDALSVWSQVEAEMVELEQALKCGEQRAIEDELGDVLFTLVNLSRHLQLDSEQALRRATQKFRQRFHWMEQHGELSALAADQLEMLWRQAKQALQSDPRS